MSEPRAIRFKARDGPWARDKNDFDYWSQLFASRGWAVLKINFRGSAGFVFRGSFIY